MFGACNIAQNTTFHTGMLIFFSAKMLLTFPLLVLLSADEGSRSYQENRRNTLRTRYSSRETRFAPSQFTTIINTTIANGALKYSITSSSVLHLYDIELLLSISYTANTKTRRQKLDTSCQFKVRQIQLRPTFKEVTGSQYICNSWCNKGTFNIVHDDQINFNYYPTTITDKSPSDEQPVTVSLDLFPIAFLSQFSI